MGAATYYCILFPLLTTDHIVVAPFSTQSKSLYFLVNKSLSKYNQKTINDNQTTIKQQSKHNHSATYNNDNNFNNVNKERLCQ